MSLFLILMYLTAVISVLLGVAGFIMLIYGLIVKNKKLTISGSIFTGVAIILIISGVFCVAGRAKTFVKNRHFRQMEMVKEFGGPDMEWMDMDSTMCKGDSVCGKADSMCIQLKLKCDNMKMFNSLRGEKKMKFGTMMKCANMKNCDPAMCKSKCPKAKE